MVNKLFKLQKIQNVIPTYGRFMVKQKGMKGKSILMIDVLHKTLNCYEGDKVRTMDVY